MTGKIFMPLEMDKDIWELNGKILFLNGAFERVLTDEEREKLETHRLHRYDSVKIEYVKEKVEPFVDQIIQAVTKRIGQYQEVGYSFNYWKRFLYVWVMKYCITTYYVTELFTEIKKQVNGQMIETAIYRSSDREVACFKNDFINAPCNEWIAYIGSKAIDLKIKYYEKNSGEDFISHEVGGMLGCAKSFVSKFWRKLNHISINKIKFKFYSKRPKCNVEVLYGNSYFDEADIQKLLIETHGRVQLLNFLYVPKCKVIDCNYRNYLKTKLKSEITIDALWKEIIRDTIIDYLPAMYIEQYNEYHSAAIQFLNKYPKLRVIKVLTELMAINATMFVCHLAREVYGIKIAGAQHGGNYGIQKNVAWYEEHVEDVFYGWGAWARDRRTRIACKSSPSDKLHKYSDKSKSEKYVLFVGTVIPSQINFYTSQTDILDGERYITWQLDFINNLATEDREMLLLKNYPIEYGWDINGIVRKKFPCVKIFDDYGWTSWGMLDGGVRDKDFALLLLNCKIFVCDHLSTTWLEALKVGKPLVLFYPKDKYVYEELELPFIQMMEDAELIVHSPKRAAEIVNAMHHDDSWWNCVARQKVVSIIRERYLHTERDVVRWWGKELLSIAKGV